MKMCEYYDSAIVRGYCNVQACCPKNTNRKCQIIPPKKAVKKIKGWAIFVSGGHISVWNEKKYSHKIPCTILIEQKYLKGKGAKQ